MNKDAQILALKAENAALKLKYDDACDKLARATSDIEAGLYNRPKMFSGVDDETWRILQVLARGEPLTEGHLASKNNPANALNRMAEYITARLNGTGITLLATRIASSDAAPCYALSTTDAHLLRVIMRGQVQPQRPVLEAVKPSAKKPATRESRLEAARKARLAAAAAHFKAPQAPKQGGQQHG